MAKKNTTLPANLAAAQVEFTRWRAERKVGDRIPGPLWALAVKLAGRYGLHRVSKTLKLDYYGLKKRLEAPPAEHSTASPAFVELLPGSPGSAGRCTIECETTHGERIRIHLQGEELSELRSFCSELWSSLR